MKVFIKSMTVFVLIISVFLSLGAILANAAAIPVPKVKFYSVIKTSYRLGDRIDFKIYSPNFPGKVQYRTVLYNITTKKSQELWTAGDKYNGNSKLYGRDITNLKWKITQPGNYRITVYTKRAGLPSSKTLNKKYNYDSYVTGGSFSVTKPMEYFTLGSTRQAVLKALGNPLKAMIYDEKYSMRYKNAMIYLDKGTALGRVVGWTNQGVPNIVLGPKNPSAPPFSIGSSMDSVAKAMGVPRFIPPYYLNEKDDYWIYKDDSIVFFDKNQRVVSYINKGSLKVLLGHKDPKAQGISYKSRIADVVNVMGTPDTVNAFFIKSADYTKYGIAVTVYPNPYIGDMYTVKFNSDYTYYQYKNSFVAFDRNEKLIYFINKGNLNMNFGQRSPDSTGLKVDSTEEDIAQAMGTPDKILDNSEYKRNWFYGNSYVMVDLNGQIVGWVNNGNLNISKNDSVITAPIISIGSTKDDVLKAMGTPTQFYFNSWSYGAARVGFNDKGQVDVIYNTKGIKLSNSQKDEASPGFTFGSSVDEVMKAMGAPDVVKRGGYNNNYIEWSYGLAGPVASSEAVVYFNSEGKVVYWEASYNDSTSLKLAVAPEFDAAAPPVTLGSTKADVLKAMGTPSSAQTVPEVKEGIWHYGTSYINFGKDEKVIAWNNYTKGLKVFLGDEALGATFSFESSKTDVLKAMGTPNSIRFDVQYPLEQWYYASGWVGFDTTTNKVNSWVNSKELKVAGLTPDPNTVFKAGSSWKDVFKVMGLPDNIIIEGSPLGSIYETCSVLRYGYSRIDLNKDGIVLRWNNNDGNLKVE